MFFGCRKRLVVSLIAPVAVFLASCGLFHTTSTTAGTGQEVVDGKFAFIVNDFGTSPTFDNTPARGIWLIVSMAIRNLSTEAQSFDLAAQSLKESDGRGHSASFMDPPSVSKIDPGLQMSVKLAFDVPPGVRPTQIVLHQSASSPGAPVNLKQPSSSPPRG